MEPEKRFAIDSCGSWLPVACGRIDAFTAEAGFLYPIRDHKRHTCRPAVDVCLKTERQVSMDTSPAILAMLQSAWSAPTVSDSKHSHGIDFEVLGVAIERCKSHLPPFDAIESADAFRPGWLRSTCRRCGKFLGYRPANGQAILVFTEARNGVINRTESPD